MCFSFCLLGAGLLMRAVVEEGDEALAARMQHLALSEAALPRHLLTAFYTKKPAGTTTTTTFIVVFNSVVKQ